MGVMRDKKLIQVLQILLLCLASFNVSAQDLKKHNWYFGSSTSGIRFNRGTNQAQLVDNQALPFNKGGAAVATDPATANLLFYTDGVEVYDANHLLMPNGNGLNGQIDTNQPVAISPMPGQTNKYFIFTNSANGTTGGSISFSTVDMNQFGNSVFPAPPAGVVEASKNIAIPGLSNRSEGMMVVPHSNRTDFWLITHQNGSQSYSATLIDASASFPTTTTSGVGLPTTVSNFSYHETSGKVAVSAQDPNTDAIILNFDNTSGVFSFDRYILNSGTSTTNNQSIYDIEWDPLGRYLYLSRHGDTGIQADVLQYDYTNPSVSLTSVLSNPVFRSYGLQIAPDSAIYHLYQAVSGGPFLIGKFTKTDTVASAVVNSQALFSSKDFSGKQLPSFTPKDSVIINLSFVSSGSCQNSPTAFFPSVTPNADSLLWNFGDTISTAWSPIHTYANAGTFNVSLTAFYQGQKQTITQPVTINPFALQLQLVQDTTACRSEFPPPRGTSSPQQFSVKVDITGGTASSILWSNGDTGETLTPDSAGYYYVVVTDASGCSAYAGVNVKEYGLQDQRSNVWYFGNKAGIDFNTFPNPPKAIDNSIMDAPEGCAVICDRNGDVIFYTDGDKVFDQTDTEIDSGIGGDPSSTQSALIVPVPGDETLYYIFTTQAIDGTSQFELRYSLFDLKLNNGNGALIEKNVLLFSKSTERITSNGEWIIAHEYGNNTFRAYRITPEGLGEPVYSEAGSIHSFNSQQNGEGYMKFGPGNMVAVALSTPGTSNLIELFQFDNNTGRLSDYQKIDLNEPNGQIYGIEFSSGGNKLFATVKGSPSPSEIFEYFFDSLGNPHFKQSIQQNAELGAIQIGPDRQIYVAVNGSNSLGIIQVNEDTTQVSAFNLNGFALAAGTNSRLGLPNFVQITGNGFGGPAMEFTGVCLGDTTKFVGIPTDAIDEFQWFFGDGGSSTEASPSHLYAAAGTYTVSMRVYNRCSLDTTIVQKVTIFNPPAKPTLPGAAALCIGSVTLDANSGNIPGLTYLWSTGDTTKTVTFNNQAFVNVTNTDTNGCFSSAQTILADNRPQVDLGLDLTICEDNATPVLNAQNPGATYLWKINGVNAGATQTQGVDTSTPGTYTYEVTVTDPVTTCFTTDQKIYTINVSPKFTLTGTNPVGCGTATGTITLQLNASAPAAGPYSYFLSGPSFSQQGIDQTAPSTIGPLNGKLAGTYSAIVSDQVSGCTISSSFGLTDATFTAIAVAAAPNCDPVSVNVTSTAVALPLQYTVTNNGTGVISPPANSATANFSISPNLSAGTYTIDITDNAGCTFVINNFNVTPNPPISISITPDLCTTPPTITASGGTSYTWTTNVPGSIVSGANTSTIQLLPGASNATFKVTALGAGCPATDSLTVDVPSTIAPDFTQSTACDDQVTLSASPSGNFTYRWYKGGVFQPALLGQQIVLGLSENNASYQVEVVNTLSGCIVKSTAKTVEVSGIIDAAVTSTPACQDNNPFILSATTNATGINYSWFFNNSVISGESNSTTSQTAEGTYRVEISKGSCITLAEITVIKAPLPEGELLNRVMICNDPDNADPNTASVDLDPGDFILYDWFKNQISLNFTDRVYNADSQGLYEVELTNSFGCVSTDKIEVVNECIPKLVAPNAFRPTSSIPTNKDFFVYSFFITDDFEIFIYNRWGELVYQSNDRFFKWNGGFNNNPSQPLPGGMYAYVIKYVSTFRPDKGIQEKRGGVNLIR
jgi:PKD repeat protein